MFRFSKSFLQRYSSLATGRRSKSNITERIDSFFDSKQELPVRVKNLDKKVLEGKLAEIFEKFDYGIYTKSYELLSTFSSSRISDIQFELEPREIVFILNAGSEDMERRVLKKFVDLKLRSAAAKFEKQFDDKNKMTAERDPNAQTSGLIDKNGELMYGLWHNTQFLKFRISDASKLWEKRLYKMFELQDIPKMLIDMSWLNKYEYLKLRKINTQLAHLMAINKYDTVDPFKFELICEDSHFTSEVNEILSNSLKHWGTDRFPYELRMNCSLKDEVNKGKNLITICPSGGRPLDVSEILDPTNTFVLPAYSSRSARDPVFQKIKQHSLRSGAKVRRLPTNENVVWKNFHGVVEIKHVFGIINDALSRPDFEWAEAFRRNLNISKHNPKDRIMSEEELQNLSRNRYKKLSSSDSRSKPLDVNNNKFVPY